jgi:hypothetical protein
MAVGWGGGGGLCQFGSLGHQNHTLVSKIMSLRPTKRLQTSPVAEPLSVAQRRPKIMALLIQLIIFFIYHEYLLISVQKFSVSLELEYVIVVSTKSRKLHKTHHLIWGRMDPFQQHILPTG